MNVLLITEVQVIYEKLRLIEGKRNQDQVYVINKMLNKMKKVIKKVPENRKFKTGKRKNN